MAEPETEAVEVRDERELVLEWRETTLIALGVEPTCALILACEPEFDTHEFEALRVRGCPAELAVKILL